ncbi:MAG: DNA ligase D [Candidatus Dormiibacterota bacterium]
MSDRGSAGDKRVNKRGSKQSTSEEGTASGSASRLGPYQRKRNFSLSPEPSGARRSRAKTALPAGSWDQLPRGHRFCVQLHRARRLHYDFRLEHAGVLLSWAVPKGPSMDPKQRRLAVQVEDHPIDYGDFEGQIPSGYGAGTVLVWDLGERSWVEGPKGQVTEGLRDGHLDFELNGTKLKGGFSLIRMDHGASGKKDEWLLIKRPDSAADPELVFPDTSAKTGRNLDQVAEGAADASPDAPDLKALVKDAPKAKLPATLMPMLATLVDRPFSSPDWLFELKYDGVRALVKWTKGRISVQGRSGRDETARYPELQELPGLLSADDCLIDGEIVILDLDGHPSFERLQHRMHLQPAEAERASQDQAVTFMAFDLLFVQGHDLMRLPLKLRKRALRSILRDGRVARYADDVEEAGESFYAQVCEAGLEGLVAKRIDSSYLPGKRSREWLKLKARPTQDCVICGYVPGQGRRARLGALVLGVYAGGQLVDAGRVGTGFSEELLRDLEKRLAARRRQTSPFKETSTRDRDVVWTRPDLVCEVEHAGWTSAQKLRQPSFRSLRPDVPPEACIREPAVSQVKLRQESTEASPRGRPPAEKPRSSERGTDPEIAAALDQLAQMPPAGGVLEIGQRQLKVSHLDKLMWPQAKISKRDLISYHLRISPFLLPHLRDRAIVLQVFPDGIEGKSFWRRSLPESAPSWIPKWRATPGTPTICPLFQEPAALAWAANQGAIDIHPWHSRRDRPTQPDWAVFDLDPSPGASFGEVLEVARMVKAGLDHLKLRSVVKTTGQKGLHIYVPIRRHPVEEEVRDWVGEFAHHLVEAAPSLLTESWSVKGRQGRIRVDYTQNVIGKTLAAVYSPRPFPSGRVSTPLEWEELEGLDPAEFTLSRVVERAQTQGDLFEAALEGGQTLPPLGGSDSSNRRQASRTKRK